MQSHTAHQGCAQYPWSQPRAQYRYFHSKDMGMQLISNLYSDHARVNKVALSGYLSVLFPFIISAGCDPRNDSNCWCLTGFLASSHQAYDSTIKL